MSSLRRLGRADHGGELRRQRRYRLLDDLAGGVMVLR